MFRNLFFALVALVGMGGGAGAQSLGIGANTAAIVHGPQCTPKVVPYSATKYSKVVIQGDSITQHDNVPGTGNTFSNPSVVAQFITVNGSPVITYTGADLATLAPYTNQIITGTGMGAGQFLLSALNSTQLLLGGNANVSATSNLTISSPQQTATAAWTIQNSSIGEVINSQAYNPYFRFDTYNDVTRNWGEFSNTAPMMRGANLGYSGGGLAGLLNHAEEYMYADPDILIFSVGTNNITLSTFQQDFARIVDRAHAWCPSLPIFVTNIRATAASLVASRPTGGIVYDNTLIAGIVSARPWLHLIDLFTPYANNPSPSAGSTIASMNTVANSGTINYTGNFDLRQFGVQINQVVTGTPISGTCTVTGVAVSSFTVTPNTCVASTLTAQTLTFTPFAFANQTGLDINYVQSYPVGGSDGLHPGTYGAQVLGAPAISTAICSVIVGNCTPSSTHNVFIDNPNVSMLTTNPAALLTGTPAALNKAATGTGVVTGTATWLISDTSMTVSGPTGPITIGMAITSAAGLAANTHVTNVVGPVITFSPASTLGETGVAVTFSPAASGLEPQGLDLAINNNTFSSYVSSVVANPETGGNMWNIVVYPAGSATTENLTVRPTGINLAASTVCVSTWCQMWMEFEVDQNPGWTVITPKQTERNAAYSGAYSSQGAQGIIPQGGGSTRRVWVHTECFPFPGNSTGAGPSFLVGHAPSLDTGTPTIVIRRWDIRPCTSPRNIFNGQGYNDNHLPILKKAA